MVEIFRFYKEILADACEDKTKKLMEWNTVPYSFQPEICA